MNWSRHVALDSPAGVWLAVGTAIFLSFALCIALSKLVWWFRTRRREADESEKEYWRIHG